MARAAVEREGLQGRHVLLVLCVFFGVMFLVNGIFVYAALTTFSGGDTSDPYRKGLNYNATLKADERQAERGWQTDLAYDAKTRRLQLSFVGKDAAPISGLNIRAKLSRPVTDKEDRHIVLAETSKGVYAAAIDLPPGLWILSASSRTSAGYPGGVYRLKRRLIISETP
jgi:nitrogen fixation protein FixH